MSIIIEISVELVPLSGTRTNRRTGLVTSLPDKNNYTAKEIQKEWDKGYVFDFRDGIPDYWDGAFTYKGDWRNRYVRIWYNNKTQSIILSGNMECPTCGHIEKYPYEKQFHSDYY